MTFQIKWLSINNFGDYNYTLFVTKSPIESSELVVENVKWKIESELVVKKLKISFINRLFRKFHSLLFVGKHSK